MRTSPSSALILGLVLIMCLFGHSYGQLRVGFYSGKCGYKDVEKVIDDFVKDKYKEEADTVSDLVRLTFHDCFVEGCDASVFLDGEDTEKQAEPNLTLGGLDTIDEMKDAVEKACPGVVSCADLLFIGARSAIHAAGGHWFEVETGRRDSLVSFKQDALANLPPPTIPIPQAIQIFRDRGLSEADFVVLLGGHTVGTAHCHSFKERLYDFNNTNKPDPSISSAMLQLLQKTCPLDSQVDNEAFLDQTPKSEFVFDNAYYKQIRAHNGTLEIDQKLALHSKTKNTVKNLASSTGKFLDKFGPALNRMGRIKVITGNEGEIRTSCRAINPTIPLLSDAEANSVKVSTM